MKNDNLNIQQQTKPKSILDMTPFELSQIDAYQNSNRGFEDDERFEDMEEYYND